MADFQKEKKRGGGYLRARVGGIWTVEDGERSGEARLDRVMPEDG